MGIESYFKGSRVLGNIVGKRNEYLNLSRFSRGTSRAQLNNVFKALLQEDTVAVDGDTFVIDGESYFVTAMRSSHTGTTMCQLQKTNATIDILRVTKHYNASKANDYDYEVPLHTVVTVFYEDVNTKTAMYDAGLLNTSTRRFLTPMLAGVKLLDRIRFNGEPMQVDGINTSSYPGLLWIQCKPDNRPTKAVTL